MVLSPLFLPGPDSHLEAEVVGEEEGVSGVRRRRGSLLAALERIGREEEEEEEEEFRSPQQREQEETGFSLNKCILGAVILLGLGTIFFSGVCLCSFCYHGNIQYCYL